MRSSSMRLSSRALAWLVVALVAATAVAMLVAKSLHLQEARRVQVAEQARRDAELRVAKRAEASREDRLHAAYLAEVARLGPAIDPRRMLDDAGVHDAWAAIARYREASRAFDSTLSQSMPEKVAPQVQRLRENHDAQADALEEIVAFFAAHRAGITLDARGPVFADDQRLAEYNAIAHRLRALTLEERQLSAFLLSQD
jgi:thioesterase domain-containing protein